MPKPTPQPGPRVPWWIAILVMTIAHVTLTTTEHGFVLAVVVRSMPGS